MAPGVLIEQTQKTGGDPHNHETPKNDIYGRYHPADPKDLKLESNYGPMIPDQIGYLQPTSADTPLAVMRERFNNDGYLLVKALLPRDKVLDCRAKYFSHVFPSGILRTDSDPVDGICCDENPLKYIPPGPVRRRFGIAGDTESDRYAELMVSAHDTDFYQRFCEIPELHSFVRRFTGWEKPQMLQRTLLRPYPPNAELTAIHYDQIYLRGGPPTALTAWLPIGDIRLEGGGLMYLEKSMDIGQQTEAEFARGASESELTDEERVSAFNKNMTDGGFLSRDTVRYGQEAQRKWLIYQYEAGDVVFHNPFLVHASCKNMDPENRIRLATDVRFVDSEKPYDKRWMKVYRPFDGL